MNKDLLQGLTVVDFTGRLPGPMGSMILTQLGAKVIKIENSNRPDPFSTQELQKVNPCFKDWYEQLNLDKKIVRFDFEKQKDLIKQTIQKVDALLVPDHPVFIDFVHSLQSECKVMIKLAGGVGQWKSLHDLNALALSKTFALHSLDSKFPPYLPFAGMAFGQYIATTILAGVFRAQKTGQNVAEVIYLKDITLRIFDALYSESFQKHPRQLHNGVFPAYRMYHSQDQKILCLAAIEEKYWKRFIDCFGLELTMEDRFDTGPKTAKILEKTFEKLDANVIKDKIKDYDVCLTILEY